MSIATRIFTQGRSIASRFAALPTASLTMRLVGCTRLTAGAFFAWLHFYDAHAPLNRQRNLHPRTARDAYVGAIGFIDFQLSRVIKFLDERGLLDSTVVVVVGDHGESLGEHGEASHGLFVYESVMRVPLIIRAPFANMQGRRVRDPVRIVDVAPTVLDLLGQTAAPATDGKTLVPLMSGAVRELGLEAYSESRYGFDRFGWSPLTALRQGRFKLILAPRPELYDLASDPHEITNLYRSASSTGDDAHATSAGDRAAAERAASGRRARHGLRHARPARGARIR